MSAIEKETEPITSAWKIFDSQKGPKQLSHDSAAFADFLLLKEQI
jgi:hypothetical protein